MGPAAFVSGRPSTRYGSQGEAPAEARSTHLRELVDVVVRPVVDGHDRAGRRELDDLDPAGRAWVTDRWEDAHDTAPWVSSSLA